LGKREYSYAELGQKLKTYLAEDEDFEQITEILEDFKTRGWLSDARFTEQIVHARSHKFGASKIANELREKGVADDLIETAIEQVKENELDNAKQIWHKKFKAIPASREEWARQARFLQSRGFGFDIIKKVLNTKTDE
jgi:regulatory protein